MKLLVPNISAGSSANKGVDKFVIVGGWDVVKCIHADILPQNTMYSNIR